MCATDREPLLRYPVPARAGRPGPRRQLVATADRICIRLLIVHALHERAAAFYSALGFAPSPTGPLHLLLTIGDARASL